MRKPDCTHPHARRLSAVQERQLLLTGRARSSLLGTGSGCRRPLLKQHCQHCHSCSRNLAQE